MLSLLLVAMDVFVLILLVSFLHFIFWNEHYTQHIITTHITSQLPPMVVAHGPNCNECVRSRDSIQKKLQGCVQNSGINVVKKETKLIDLQR